MRITYDIGEEDILFLEQFTLAHNKPLRAKVLREQFGSAAATAALSAVVTLLLVSRHGGISRFAVIGAAIGAALAFALSLLVSRLGHPSRIRAALRKNVAAGAYKGIIGLHQMTLLPDAVVSRGPLGEGRLEWSSFTGFSMVTNGTIYFHLVDGKSLIVPRRAFTSDEQKQTFFNEAGRYFNDYQADPGVVKRALAEAAR